VNKVDIIKNLGISYRGDYINQGSNIEKCKKSTELGTLYTGFVIRNDGKGTIVDNLSSYYNGNIILHLPTINTSQTNLKNVKDIVISLLPNNLKLLTIDASLLLADTYDWCTVEEQQNYLKNMANGIASLCEFNIDIAIENTGKEKGEEVFGRSISNISDLLVYTRNALVDKYNYTREQANKRVGISLNLRKLRKYGNELDLNTWFKVFYNDIKCIKVNDIENTLNDISNVLDLVSSTNIDVPILLETKSELEKIVNEYKKFKFIVNKKLNNEPLNFDGYQEIADSTYNEYNYNIASNQSGFTSAIIVIMIIVTIVIAVLMVLVKLRG
jgi:hypothetical protein